MSEEENKGVVLRWIEAYNERDMQAEADARAPLPRHRPHDLADQDLVLRLADLGPVVELAQYPDHRALLS